MQFQSKSHQVAAWEFTFYTVQVYPTSLWIFRIWSGVLMLTVLWFYRWTVQRSWDT